MISAVAFLVSCSSSSSSVSPDAADVAAERPADSNGGAGDVIVDADADASCTPATSCGATDSNGNARDANGDVDGDCTPTTAFTCVASCASAAPAPLICDDGHWECERGVDSRQCADAGFR